MLGIQAASFHQLQVVLLLSNTADDLPAVRDALRPENPRVEVRHAQDKAGLARLLAGDRCDLALIEAGLLWTDSLAVLRAIQNQWSTCPVLMIATNAQENIVHQAIQAGLTGYVPRVEQNLVGLPTVVRLAQARISQCGPASEMYRQYRNLFDSVPVGLYRTTPEGRILDVNLTFIQMLGYTNQADLLAINAVELYVNPEDRTRWQTIVNNHQAAPTFETQLYRRDGATIWVEDTVAVIHDRKNDFTYYEGILKNITKRKQAEAALQASEERFRTIIEQSPISIQMMTPAGWTIQVNRAWEKLWGVTAADVKNYNLLHDEQAISLGMMPYVERGFAGETVLMPPVAYHTPESLKTGRRRWFQARIYPVRDRQGEIRNIIMMYEDITEQQWATEDLQRLSVELMKAQETERKHVSRELHDELGQALTAIRINLDMLQSEQSPDSPLTDNSRLREIGILVDETLEHVRELSHNLCPTMLDEMGLAPTLRWYTSRYAERLNIQVDVDLTTLTDRLPPELETILYRVVQEALTNIARHAQASQVRLHLVKQEAMVSLLIEDDGQGFEVAAKMAPGLSRPGLGLLGMRERVTRWGGTFTIHSQPGQGTRLFVELPLSQHFITGAP